MAWQISVIRFVLDKVFHLGEIKAAVLGPWQTIAGLFQTKKETPIDLIRRGLSEMGVEAHLETLVDEVRQRAAYWTAKESLSKQVMSDMINRSNIVEAKLPATYNYMYTFEVEWNDPASGTLMHGFRSVYADTLDTPQDIWDMFEEEQDESPSEGWIEGFRLQGIDSVWHNTGLPY
jgi:hypothetical protein